MGTFSLQLDTSPFTETSITGFFLTTFQYQSGVPGSTGPGYATPGGKSGIIQLSTYVPGHVNIITSADGTFDVGNPPPGFSFTTGLSYSLTAKIGSLGPGEFITLAQLGSAGVTLTGGVGNTIVSQIISVSLTDYPQYPIFPTVFNIINGPNNFSTFIPISPFAPGFNPPNFGFQIIGNYAIISTKWVLSNLTNPGKSFRPGDTGKLTSSDLSYDFSFMTEIDISSTITITTFTTITPAAITFVIPPNTPTNTYTPTIKSTQFSGFATLGPLTVIPADSSGIYTIASGKTNDTIYLSTQTDNTTIDNAIPNPFAKTGFIGG